MDPDNFTVDLDPVTGEVRIVEGGTGPSIELSETEGERLTGLDRERRIQERADQLSQGALDPALAAAYSFVDDPLLGVPSLVLRQYLGEDDYAALMELRSRNAAFSTVGGIGGSLASLAIPGAPANLALRAGSAATRALTPLVGRGLALGAGATLEGALEGLNEGVRQNLIQDAPFNAQLLMSNGALGAALGLGSYGLIRGAQRLTSGARQALTGAPEIASSVLGRETAEELQEDVVAFNSRVRSLDGPLSLGVGIETRAPSSRELMESVMSGVPDERIGRIRQYRYRAMGGPTPVDTLLGRLPGGEDGLAAVRGTSVRRLQSLIDTVGSETQEALTSGSLRSQLAEQFPTTPGIARDISTNVATRLETLQRGTDLGLSPFIQDLRQVSTFRDLDRVIQQTDSVVSRLQRDQRGDFQAAIRVITEGLEESIASFGGEAGQAYVSAMQAARQQRRALESLTDSGIVRRGSNGRFIVNESSLEQSLGDAGSAGTAASNMTDYLESVDSALQIVGRDADRLDLRETAEWLRELRTRSTLISQKRIAQAEEKQGAGLLAGMGLGGAFLGHLLGSSTGIPGANFIGSLAVGSFIAGGTHPISAMMRAQRLTEAVNQARVRMNTGVERVTNRVINPSAPSAPRAERVIPQVTLRLRSPEEREEEYQSVVASLRELQNDPELLLTQMNATVDGTVDDIGTDFSDQINLSMLRAYSYLLQQLPPPPPTSILDHGIPPAPREIRTFLQKYEIVEDPFLALDYLADGVLTRNHVEALEIVYPDLAQHMRTEIAVSMEGQRVPRQSQVLLSTFMNVPLSTSLTPNYIFGMQQTYSQTIQQDQVQRTPTQVSNDIGIHTLSASQSVATRLTY